MQSALIVGGGIVGLATALQLRQKFPQAKVTVVEKEAEAGQHQSTHNSGVLHCGLYYQPGSLKARLAVTGIRLMTDFCRSNEVPHEICGKLVVATSDEEIPRLTELLRRGTANGLKGLKQIDAHEIRQLEPHAAGVAAAHVPEEGIVDYRAVIQAMVLRLRLSEVKVETNFEVIRLTKNAQGWTAEANRRQAEGEWLINCAGLHCDRVSLMAGHRREARIVPFRGEYYRLQPAAAHLCRHLIYPVPNPSFPFLGVHFTRMMGGGVEAGPNAILATAREGYRKTDVCLADAWDALSFVGLWRFMWKYPRMVMSELGQSMSKRLFCRALQRLVPEITISDLATGGAGVRAQAMLPNGTLLQDFHVVRGEKALHLLNAPSLAATASLAIGEHLVAMLD